MKSHFHELHEFAIYTISQGSYERWQLMPKLVRFTGVHFPDLNPKSYDNLNNVKLDLKCLSTTKQDQI